MAVVMAVVEMMMGTDGGSGVGGGCSDFLKSVRATRTPNKPRRISSG